MAKKNFKDVTGIKFADLIMPLVMGGIGSYSPAAGRGVGLGLQAFRTFQAGQAFGDEREEKKAYKEWTEQQAQQAQQEFEQIQQGKIDQSEVEHKGFEGKRGPATPVGGSEVERTPLGKGQISLFGDDGATMEGGVDLDRGGEISGVMGGSGQDLLTEAILGRKRSQDAAARDLEIAKGNMTFTQALQHSDPNTGAYMSMQKVVAEQKRRDNLASNLQMSAEYAANDRQRQKLDAMSINLRADRKKDVMAYAAQLEKMGIKHFQLSDDRILEYNPERGKEGMSKWSMKDFGPVDLEDVPIEERIDLFYKGVNTYDKMATTQANLGEDAGTTENMSRNRKIMAELWASLNNAEGLPQMYGLLEQFNAQVQAPKGLPPLTMEQYLARFGIKSGYETSAHGNSRTDKFKIQQ